MTRLVLILMCIFGAASSSFGMTLSQRNALDLSVYTVTNPNAGFFDYMARRAFLLETQDPLLMVEVQERQMGMACQDLLDLPMIDHRALVPAFYDDPVNWRDHAKPYLAFEEAMTDLLAAQIVSNDDYHANCLVDVLLKWAAADALVNFHTGTDRRQAWYQIESPIFAAAMSFAAIRPLVKDRDVDLERITAWLVRISKHHISFPGGRGTCCNNHFYRRALHAVMVGVLANDNELFQFGVSAIYSAIDGALPNGALPLEMERGVMAAHYQNYAVMYLIWIAEIAERQGYTPFDLEIDGKTLATLVDFNLAILEDLSVLDELVDAPHQKLVYQQDDQYFAWFELYLSKFPSEQMDEIIRIRRPLFNRSAGGHTTLLYHMPNEQMN